MTQRRSSRTARTGSRRSTAASPASRSGACATQPATSSLEIRSPSGPVQALISPRSTPPASIAVERDAERDLAARRLLAGPAHQRGEHRVAEQPLGRVLHPGVDDHRRQRGSSSTAPGASGTRPGCRMWAISSSPSTSRGPGREKYADGVDRDHAPRAQRRQLVGVGLGLLERALGVVAARHADDDVRPRGRDLLPRAGLRVLAGQAEEVDPAGVLDQLRRPVAGHEDGVEPLERGDGDRRRVAHREPHAVDPRRRGGDQVDGGVLGVGRPGQRADVAQHLAERGRVERDDRGRRVHPLGDRADVVVGDGADRAQRLGHDQVGRERLQHALVELVDRAALLGQLAHGAVDLVRRQPGADQVAGDPG